jgi:dihydrofolate synthase/folylpolyglutamate synthase
MRDEDIAGVIEYMKGEVDHWCVTDLPTPRAASAQPVEAGLRKAGLTDGTDRSVARFASPAHTYQDALKRASANDRIVVFGSFYTAAGVMAYRESQQH